MRTRRVLAVGLDGYEHSLAEGLMAEGLLPNMRRLRAQSARFLLDHGRDKYSGLTWEQVSTGKTCAAAGRWSPVTFHPSSYRVSQDPTASAPFLAGLAAEAVVFDLPYCDLSRAPRVRGVTDWGAHDPGVARASRPAGLHAELAARFGPYPAADHLYGMFWQSAEKTRVAAEALAKAVRVRAAAARWLLGERLPDWELGIVVISESHSAVEPMWHGVDAGHPLHGLPSAAAAREGLRRVYLAIDDLLGELAAAFADATLVLFAMHGMGPNDADVAGMVLLGELLYRHSFGKPYLREPAWRAHTPQGVPLLTEGQNWQAELRAAVPMPGRFWLARSDLDWMPAARYRHRWPKMKAFALPAFADGRVRINLRGRERRGVVPPANYEAVRAELVELLRACREPLTGESVIEHVDYPDKHPYEIGPTEADLYVLWRGAPLGLVHPQLGRIGPLPYRRTGGHTGAWGFAYLMGDAFAPGEHGTASSFDVVPTLLDLLGQRRPAGVCGRSLVGRAVAAPTT
jgi:predicted AlkP superfamily phosphohydrolase/phosphomutase